MCLLVWKTLFAVDKKSKSYLTATPFCDKRKKPLLVRSLNRVTKAEQARFRSHKEPSSRSAAHVMKEVVM